MVSKFRLLFVLFALSVLSAPAHAADILLGMSTALTGPTAELGKGMRDGVLIGLDRANRGGGIGGRRLRLLPLDDGYEPARTVPNMRRLIEAEKVLAVIGNVGTPTAIASLPLVKKDRTLFFAPFTGAGVLRQDPPDRYVINYRASYAEEIAAMVDALIDAGLQPADIAFFTQRDGYGDAGFAGGCAALKRHGLKDERQLLHVRYPRNTLAVENALADVLLAGRTPKAIIMVGAYAPCAKFIRLARQSGLQALFLSVSFVGSDFLAEALGTRIEGVIVTQVVPHPDDATLPIVRQYRDDLRAWGGNARPTFASLEGYVAARILAAALARLHGEPTREGIIDALEGLGTFDLGLGHPLQLDRQRHQASGTVWPTLLRQGRFVPFAWSDIPSLLARPRP